MQLDSSFHLNANFEMHKEQIDYYNIYGEFLHQKNYRKIQILSVWEFSTTCYGFSKYNSKNQHMYLKFVTEKDFTSGNSALRSLLILL